MEIQRHFKYFLRCFYLISGCGLLMWGKNSGEKGSVVRGGEFPNNVQKRSSADRLAGICGFQTNLVDHLLVLVDEDVG